MNQENHQELLAAVDRFHSRWRQVRTLLGVARLLLIAAVFAALCSVIDYHFELDPVGRYSLTSLFYAVIGISAVYLVILPLVKGLPSTRLAWMIEQRHPQLREILASTLELTSGKKEHLSEEMIDQVLEECTKKVCRIKPRKTFPLTLQMFSIELAVLSLFCIAMSIPSLQFPDLLLRVAVPADHQPGIGSFQLNFQSPSVNRMTEGARTTFEVSTDNPGLSSVVVYFRYPDGRIEQESILRRDESENFILVTDGFYDSVEYWAKAGKVSTGKRLLKIRKRPKIVSFFIRHTPPAHTELPPVDVISTSGDLKALANTTIEMRIKSTKPLSSMDINRDGKSVPVELSADRREASCNFLVDRSGNYTVHMRDASGLGSPDGINYTVTMIPDSAPEITVFQPTSEVFAERDGSVKLSWNSRDDFGIAHQEISCTVLGGTSYTFPIPPDARSFGLELDQLSLDVGDELQITIRALDATRQETVSSPTSIFILDTAEFNTANRFREVLEDLSRDLKESQTSLKEVESSIQEVILGQSTNIKENADLGHHLTMLNHRVERLDRHLLRVISHIPALEETAFFPYSHHILRDIELTIGTQLVFGQYHEKHSITAVKKGQLECQQVIMRCINAVQLMRDFANRWIVDTIGKTTLSALRSASAKSTKGDSHRAFYNSKLRICYTILPDPKLKSLMIENEGPRISPDKLAKKLENYLKKNSESVQNYALLQAELREFRRLPGNLDNQLSAYAAVFRKEDPVDPWSPSKRFKAFLQAPRQVSAERAGDRILLNEVLVQAEKHRSDRLFRLAYQAWRRTKHYYSTRLMSRRAESLHLYVERLIESEKVSPATALDSLRRHHPDIYVKLLDEIEFSRSTPLIRMSEDRNRTRLKDLSDQLGNFAKDLSTKPGKNQNPTTLESLHNFSKDTDSFFQALLRSDLRWLNLMKKAIRKELPSPSKKLSVLCDRLQSVIDSSNINTPGKISDLEDIVRELYAYANSMEKAALGDDLRQVGDFSVVELRLGIAYTVYEVLASDITPPLQELVQSQETGIPLSSMPGLNPIDSLKNALELLRKLSSIMGEQEAVAFGLRNLSQAHELRVNIRETTQKVFPPELIGYLSFLDQMNRTHQRLEYISNGLPEPDPDSPTSLSTESLTSLRKSQADHISDEALAMIQAIAPSSLRSVIREHALQSIRGFVELRRRIQGTVIPEQHEALSAQATFAELNLKFAEDVNTLVQLPNVSLSPIIKNDIISKLADTDSPLSPAAKQEMIEALDTVIRGAKALADNALFAPVINSTPPPSDVFVLSAGSQDAVSNALIRIRYSLLFIQTHSEIRKKLEQKRKNLIGDYRKQLSELKKGTDEAAPSTTVIIILQKDAGKVSPDDQLKQLGVLAKQYNLADVELSPLRSLFTTELLQSKQRILEQDMLLEKAVAELGRSVQDAKNLIRPYAGNRGGVACIELINHLSDSIDLGDFVQARRNLEALIASVSVPVPSGISFQTSSKPIGLEPGEMIFPTNLPSNPFSVKAIIEANQDNRLPISIRQKAAQFISQGAYHSARMILPSHLAETLHLAQEGDSLAPRDALPAAFRGNQLELTPQRNSLPPAHFNTLSKLYLLGNRAAVYHYLNGDREKAHESLARFSATLPDERAVVCDSLIAELRGLSDYGYDFNEVTELPEEASDVVKLLLGLRTTDYIFELEHVLVAFLENYRALSFLVNRQYREAANAVYGLLELMPGYPSEDLETGLLRLVELDLSLYPSENSLVREAIRKMPYGVPAVTNAVSTGDLKLASKTTARLGMNASSELFHNATVHLESSRSQRELQAATYLQSAIDATDNDRELESLQSALNFLNTGHSTKAYETLEGYITGASAQLKALIELEEAVASRDQRLAMIDKAIASARKGNIPAAIRTLKLSPELHAAVRQLKQARQSLERGMTASLTATVNDIPFGVQRSLNAAFNAAVKYDLVAAFAAAERAGEHGKSASSNFSKARTSAQKAISLLEREQVRLIDRPLIDQVTISQLTTGIADKDRLEEITYMLKQKDYEKAISVIRTQKPESLDAYQAFLILSSPKSPMKDADMVGLVSGPQQEVKYLLRLMVTLHSLSKDPRSADAPELIRSSTALNEAIMDVLSSRVQRLLQELQNQKSKDLVALRSRFLSAGQRAWISRLETESYDDFSDKRMSLGISFLRGEKQNYSAYYKEANRHYLNWLLEQSKVSPEKATSP